MNLTQIQAVAKRLVEEHSEIKITLIIIAPIADGQFCLRIIVPDEASKDKIGNQYKCTIDGQDTVVPITVIVGGPVLPSAADGPTIELRSPAIEDMSVLDVGDYNVPFNPPASGESPPST